MKIKEILTMAAEMLGMEECAAYLAGNAADRPDEREAEVKKLLSAYNRALQELATDFEPLLTADTFTDRSSLEFSELGRRPLDIVSCKDAKGDDIPGEHSITGMTFARPQASATVVYRYLPSERQAEDEFEYIYGYRTTPRVAALGTAAEFLHAAGAFSEAADMRSRFHKAALAALRPKGRLVLPGRNWT